MDNSKQIIALYDDYNTIIKPLIAEVEARTEQFPLPLFNEIRALHDHIARCYFKGKHPTPMTIQLHPQCLLGIQGILRNWTFLIFKQV